MAFRHFIFLMMVNLVWGFGMVASKVGLGHFPPFFFTFLRGVIILAAIWPFLRFRRDKMRDIVIIGLCTSPLSFGFMYMGISLSTASVGAVVAQLGVPFVTILSVIFLKERVNWRRWGGIFLAFAGVMLITFDPAVFQYRLGILFMVGSLIAYAVSMIFQRRLKDVGVYELQAWIAVVTLPSTLLISLLFESNQWELLQTASLAEWGGCFYVAFGMTLVGHAGMYYLLQRYEVTQVAPITLFAPIASILFGVLLLGDVLTPMMIVGAIITLTGVLIISLRQKEIVEPGS